MPMSADTVESMTVVYPLTNAASGVDEDQHNPFRRALAPMMEDNKLLPNLLPVFLAGANGSPQYWLGVFVVSPGERILFFPGHDVQTDAVRGSDRGRETFRHDFALDHLTLERNRDAWHITSPKSASHKSGPKPLDLGDGRSFWFTMAVQELDTLRTVRERTVARFDVQDKTRRHRATQLQQLSNDAKAAKLVIPSMPTDERPYFPFFAIIVGLTDFEIYRGPDWWPPYGSEHVHGGPPIGTAISISNRTVTQVPLDRTTDLQLVACWLPGSLSVPMIHTSPIRYDSTTELTSWSTQGMRLRARELLRMDRAGETSRNELFCIVNWLAGRIWLDNGATHGHHEADWYEARRELGIPDDVFV
jgi:hypothetical protein